MSVASAKPLFVTASRTSSGALAARTLVKGDHIDEHYYQSVLTE